MRRKKRRGRKSLAYIGENNIRRVREMKVNVFARATPPHICRLHTTHTRARARVYTLSHVLSSTDSEMDVCTKAYFRFQIFS